MTVSPEAREDLREATAYYDGQQEGLGDEFVTAVDRVFARIERMQEMRPVVYRGMRRFLLERFPFAVYCRIEAGEVVVLAVTHSRRDPKTWRSRA